MEFNDPFECNPTLICDSNNDELKNLFGFLLNKRVFSEIATHLKIAGLEDESVREHARNQALNMTKRELVDISYLATDPDYDGTIEENESWLLLEGIKRELLHSYERGVCCFSTSYKNPLMWSHYSCQHKGICIGYNTNRNPVPELQKALYGSIRSIETSTLCDAILNGNELAKKKLERNILLRKASCWKYESEWRLIGQRGTRDSPLLMTDVTFGLRCSNTIAHTIIKALEGRDNEVKFYKMRQDSNSFKLHRHLIDIDELQSYFPNTAKSGVELGFVPLSI